MLEAITDFWKPVKKTAQAAKLKLTDMQIGSIVTFGYVPQAALSGKKLTVSSINSYQFGQDVLTSFVLNNEKDGMISVIIAEAQGEQYLAISRRISESERSRLFDEDSIKEVTSNNEVSTFKCKDNIPELKGWLVSNYKREIQGMRGFLHKADFRNGNTGSHSGAEFSYTLLGSNSNEHAIEIESYKDGHMDIYATIYRRTSDITDVTNNDDKTQKSDVKLVSKNEELPVKAPEPAKSAQQPVINIPDTTEKPVEAAKPEKNTPKLDNGSEITLKSDKPEPPKLASSASEPVKLESVALPQMVATPLAPELEKPKAEEIKQEPEAVKVEPVKAEPAKEEISRKEEVKAQEPETKKPTITEPEPIKNNEEKKIMSTATTMGNDIKPAGTNGTAPADPSAKNFGNYNKDYNNKQEIKAVNKITNGMDNESVECDLRVANQLIDEAIRNEMRLSDVVRRIIELPVAHQEAVHIPINLADEDYSLLAIRYGIPSTDRNAIKLRIIQDLGDFSGNKKKAS